MKRLPSSVLAVATLGVLAAGCATAWNEHLGVPLVWREEDEALIPVRTSLLPHRFKLERVVDRRAEPSVIGVNIQRPERHLLVTTRDDVGAWATQQLARVLRRQGLELVESGETETLEVELTRLMVTEANRFNGNVELSVKVHNARGDLIWSGGLAGESKRWGRTYNLQNYYQAITIAFDGAARGLLTDPAFQAALGR